MTSPHKIASKDLGFTTYIIGDIINLILSLSPSIISYLFTYSVISLFVWPLINFYSIIFILPLAVLIFIFTVFCFRLILPVLKPGLYKSGPNLSFFTWVMHTCLARAIELSPYKQTIFALSITRYLYLRAMGAKVAFKVMTSLGTSWVDYPLIEIEENVTLTKEVTLSCHTFVRNKLLLKKIKIGKNSYIGARTVISLGSQIGANSNIGPYNILMMDHIPENFELKAFEWERGNPKKSHNQQKT